eukprot:8041191-Karenia_brevis.AAC.1
MAPKKKPAAAPQSLRRKRDTLSDLEFKPPGASENSNTKLNLFQKDIKQVEGTVNAARIKDGPD